MPKISIVDSLGEAGSGGARAGAAGSNGGGSSKAGRGGGAAAGEGNPEAGSPAMGGSGDSAGADDSGGTSGETSSGGATAGSSGVAGSGGGGAGASAGPITEYLVPTPKAKPVGIHGASDGNIWFVEEAGARVGRVTPAGVVTEYPLPAVTGSDKHDLTDITAGGNNDLWFIDLGMAKIDRITTTGTITEFPLPAGTFATQSLDLGSDDNVWFTANNGRVGKLTPAGVSTFYTLPTSFPGALVAGPDGNIWASEPNGVTIARITTAGVIKEFPLPQFSAAPMNLAFGHDGNVWFLGGKGVVRITQDGIMTEFVLDSALGASDIIAGSDDNLWITLASSNQIGRFTTAGVLTKFDVPTPNSYPSYMATGANGYIWFTEFNGNKIGKLKIP